ncbi:IS1096 element passenger TnpR family protein [Natronoflexus pectinivorans]|uniref:PRiA4b ORF-3-like protein n=1 Tax=Natronoflexus pectinivorans TaxID=682526 RepID=A0A4R2GII0_9BACT|nr:hypothetical protein [Natronoflexus pectinivorans]TCO07094.1 pRiA4b ORF-3-like protein [Natronoflexus pectinivorans]
MIYFFRAISNESDDFILDIAIDSKSTFLDLHQFIQQKLNFDPAQMTSFFLTDENWNKEQEITLIDMMEEEGTVLVMDKVRLEDLITDTKQRVLYAFDLFAERVLFMELTNIDGGNLKEPVCTRMEGTPPPQFSEEGFNFDDALEADAFLSDDDMDDIIREGGDFPDDLSDEDFDPDEFY